MLILLLLTKLPRAGATGRPRGMGKDGRSTLLRCLVLGWCVVGAACDEFGDHDAPAPTPSSRPGGKGSASEAKDETQDELWTTMTISLGAFVALSIVFDLLRCHVWWVYGPRLHHSKYKARTPPDPGPGPFRWAVAVAKLWSDAEFLEYAGVDGLVMIQFLNFFVDQSLFAAIVGVAVLLPTYVTARGLDDGNAGDDQGRKG